MYLFGVLFIRNFVLVFIFTLLLLSLDFYYLKNIAGRRLVGLRWWNEVNTSTGDSHWVFESRETSTAGGGMGGEVQNKTDRRFFWLAIYVAPALWVGLAVLAVVRLQKVIWLVTVGTSLHSSTSRPRPVILPQFETESRNREPTPRLLPSCSAPPLIPRSSPKTPLTNLQ
jgi:Eukaryotic protein of unknown function (DUF846)